MWNVPISKATCRLLGRSFATLISMQSNQSRPILAYSPNSRSLPILRLPPLILRPIPLDLPTLIRLQPYPSPNLVLLISYFHLAPIPSFSDEGQDGFLFGPPLGRGHFGEVGARISTGGVVEGYMDAVGS
jgi:hypothetical protein